MTDAPAPDATTLVAARNLTVDFRGRASGLTLRRPPLRAVDGVDLAIGPGEVLGLIGESGSGKTTVGRALLGLVTPTDGTIEFAGIDVSRRSRAMMRRLSTRIQAIFQDTSGTLDPRMSIRHSLDEALRRRPEPGRDRRDRAVELMASVGLGPELLSRYPHELSGGQRQRIGIARALAVEPEFIVCDEPTASLDVSVQAQVLNLLVSLRDRLGLSYLFIGHNIAVVRLVSDRVAVMYAGRVVEQGPADEVCRRPRHPYTRALVAAVAADPPPSAAPVAATAGAGGCPVRHRCALTERLGRPARCADEQPALRPAGSGHLVACHYADPDESTEDGGAR